MLSAPSAALAHATLEGTSPQRGATVQASSRPRSSSASSEPVEGNFGAVRVYDAEGARVDEGDAFHPDGEGPRLGVHLEPDLPDGSYTATYRVVSADGHIVSSGFVFSIGKPGRRPRRRSPSWSPRARQRHRVTETALGIARGVQYAALALAARRARLPPARLAARPGVRLGDGGDAGRGPPRPSRARLRARAARRPPLAGALSAAAAIVFEAAQAAGVSGFAALKETIVRETLETKFGTVWGLAVARLDRCSACGARWRCAAARAAGASHRSWPCPLAFIVLVPALSGHGSTQSPVACSSRPTSSTSPRWRSGSAASPRSSSSLPGRPGSWSRRSQPPAGGALSRFSPVALVCGRR